MSMAETNCAEWRRKSVPVWLSCCRSRVSQLPLLDGLVKKAEPINLATEIFGLLPNLIAVILRAEHGRAREM